MKSFILVLSLFAISDNVSINASYMRNIHYPIEKEHSRDCQMDYSGLQGVCKQFKECQSAQEGWFGARIYPTLCYYKRFEAIVCCLDNDSTPNFPPFSQPIIGNGNTNFPNTNNQFPILGNGQQNRPSINNEVPISNGNNQGNFPDTNNQFPNTGNEQQNRPNTNNQFDNQQQNRPSTNNQFPIFTANNQDNFPNTNNQFPNFGNEQQNRPSAQFPIINGNNQGNFPNTNNQFPILGNEQQNRPSTNNQFPISTGNDLGNFPNTNNQFPILDNGQQNRPNMNSQFPISTGNDQGNFPNTNNQFPNFGNEQQNRPSAQFPIINGNNQGNFPNTNNQFPILGNGQQNRPNMNSQFPINTGNNEGNFPNTNNQFPILGNGQQNRPNMNSQFPISTGNDQGNFPNTNNQFPIFGNGQQNRRNGQFPINTGNNQGNFPNTNNQFPILGNGQQNRPNINSQFPISTGNDQGNFPNINYQFPNLENGQQNRPNTDNQFPIVSGNNKVNPQNSNSQFPVGPSQINQTDFSDCTVVVLADPNNPVDSPCVVADPRDRNNQNQNTGQNNTQNTQINSESVLQQDQEETAADEAEVEPARISQERCESVYDVTPLVGGEPTEIGQYPFMAAIGWKRYDNELQFNCGGFLVSKKFVLTAAHCANLGGDKPFAIRTGGINLDNKTSSDLDIPIEEIIVHPDYHENQTYNDIALMRLSKNANDEIACLWQKNDIDKEYEEVIAIGYGHKQFGGPGSNSLLQIKLKLFDNNQCSLHYKPEFRFPNGIIDSQICSGDLTRAKDTCQGDSGGPIFIERTSTVGKLTPIVIGITSFGQGCAGEAPSIYTRISSFLNWIEPIVWPDVF